MMIFLRFLKANKMEVFMAGLFQIAHVEFGITQHVFVLISSQVSFIHQLYGDDGEYEENDADDLIEIGITENLCNHLPHRIHHSPSIVGVIIENLG